MKTTVERAAERPPLLTPQEAGLILGRSHRLLQRAVKEGTIPSVRLGKRRYITVGVVDALIRGEDVSPDAAPVQPRAFAGGIRLD